MSKRKRKRLKIPKRIFGYARGMKRGGAKFHELVTKDILEDILSSYDYRLKWQYCFLDKIKHKWYIADFYVEPLKLIIEIDGSHHKIDKAQVEYDQKRTEFFIREGMAVERFDNSLVESLEFRKALAATIKAYLP